MGVDFGKIFSAALKYPFRKDVYLTLFIVQLAVGISGWLISYYFVGEIITAEGLPVVEKLVPFMLYMLPVTIAGWLIWIFLMPMYFENSMHFYKGKRKALLESLNVSKKRFAPLLGLFIIIGLIFLACFGGLALLAYSVVVGMDAALLTIGGVWFLLGSIAGIVLMFMLFIAPAFCIFEKTGPLDALKKAWGLTNKNKANTLVFLILSVVIFLVVSIAGSLPEAAYVLLLGQPAELSIPSFALMIVRALFNSYLALFTYASLAFYYLSIKKTRA
jgi:hypothetical protein